MLDLIRRPPLVSSISINEEEVVEGGEMEFSLGQVIMIQVKMSNQLLEPVCDCDLSVRLLQDTLGRGVGLTAGAAGAGTPGLGQVGEVLPGGELCHNTKLLAMTPGTFKLVICAHVQFRDKPHSWRLAPITLNIKI